MPEQFDVVIIGAGIGGLTAAAKLVKSGRRVLVIEKNPHPGGTAYVYHRRGFFFPMGPLGFSNRERIQDILRELGVDNDLIWKRVRYRLKAFNYDIVLSLPFKELVKELKNQFPGESKAIESFFQYVEEIASSFKQNNVFVGKRIKDQSLVSSAEYLNDNILDWRLRRILGSLGTREPYTSLLLQAAMWDLMSNEGIWYPEEGLKSFCNRLVQLVTGDAHYSNLDLTNSAETGIICLKLEVQRIRVKNGRVCGVILADGTAVDAPFVISNADYKTTIIKLLELDTSDELYKAVSRARQTSSIFQVALGVNKIQVDLSAFIGASRLIYRRYQGDHPPEEISSWNEDNLAVEELAGQELEISMWSSEDPNLAPSGSDVVVIRTEAPYFHFKRFRLGTSRRRPGYLEYKNRLGEALIQEAEKLLPGLESAITVRDIATPLTFEDQGGRSEGAVAGWSWNYEDFHDYRPRELVLTPIKGLYMAGHQAFSALFLGGVCTAMISGYRAAEAVLGNVGPVNQLYISSYQFK